MVDRREKDQRLSSKGKWCEGWGCAGVLRTVLALEVALSTCEESAADYGEK